MGEDLPKYMQGSWKKVPVSVMKKVKQVKAKPKSSRRINVGDKLVVNGKISFHREKYDSLLNLRKRPGGFWQMVQPNIKNYCQVRKNPLMLWSNLKNCLVRANK